MADPISISALIGVLTLLIERGFVLANKIKRSRCCGSSIEFDNSNAPLTNSAPILK